MNQKKKRGSKSIEVPGEVKEVLGILENSGFEAYIVGGCVRDYLRKTPPEDWDIATNASPEKVQEIFEKEGFKTFYENDFGTVGVVLPADPERDFYDIVEVTTYRKESSYSNKRHPDEVSWAETIEEDLSRRDFTVNAIALRRSGGKSAYRIIDPFGGRKDLEKRILRAVGDPAERFGEDALRMLRGARFASTFGFSMEKKTKEAIKKNARWIESISRERIRDEFLKIIMSENAAEGVDLLKKLGLLKYILPELEEGCGESQNKHHIYDCYEHNLFSLKYAAKKNFNKHVRMAALLHDIAKPKAKKGEGPDATFYGHEVLGAKMAHDILSRMRLSKEDIRKITRLIRYHLFYYNVGEVSESSVRRLVRQVGKENVEDLLQLRMCDRIGSGVPKAEPYKLRHLRYLIEKTSRDPISVKMLAIGGGDVMRILNISPGPKVGHILEILMEKVLSDPKMNKREVLEKETERIGKMPDGKIADLAAKGRKKIERVETKRDEMTKRKYWVT